MKLIDIFLPGACVTDMQAKTKKEALRELSTVLAESVGDLDSAELLDLLLEREKLGTTALGDGIAIPHARIGSLNRLLAGFGRSRQGIDFDSIDGKRTHLFFLLLAPGNEGSAHLLTLARLSRLVSNPEIRAKLFELESVDELFRLLEEEESRS